MIKLAAVLVAAMAVAVPSATPALAQEARVDPEHIMTVLKDAGYPVESFNEDKSFRQILSKSGNYQFLVEMFDCVDGKACQTLEFFSNFPIDAAPTKEELDAYAGPREGTRIALNRRGDPTMRQELDINAPGGLSDEQFIAQLKSWETKLTRFAEYLTKAPAGPASAEAAAEAAAPAPGGEVADAT